MNYSAPHPQDIDVVILCGGKGTRLQELTRDIPKPMLKINNYPLLGIIINYIQRFGFKRFILCAGHKAEVIKNYYNCEKTKKGIEIVFSVEKKLLGTGGAIKNARSLIKNDAFIVLNGDSFCKFNPLELLKFHKKKKALVSILLLKRSFCSDYGEVKIDKFFKITGFNEKNITARNSLINSGVYVFDKKSFEFMPSKKIFSLEEDLFPMLINKNIFGYKKKVFFIDIGTPERYESAKKTLLTVF